MELRQRILELTKYHKCYGVGMIHLKLRQMGLPMNHKRMERLYQEATSMAAQAEEGACHHRATATCPAKAANELWSIDSMFDRSTEGRVIKCLTAVNDAIHEAVVIEIERAISGTGVTHVLAHLAPSRSLPKVIRTDNGREFYSKAMVTWVYKLWCATTPVEPGKPNQNAYTERSNRAFRTRS